MKKLIIPIMILISNSASALVINQNVFEENGGDLRDIKNSLKYSNNSLRDKSFEKQYLSVGKIPNCTATWLGNDNQWSYILTAAHCIRYTSEKTPINSRFLSWDDREIAKGHGFAYVPKERIHKPNGFGGASTDIAILQLPIHDILTDKQGNLVTSPIINDEFNEYGKIVSFVGYGTWGVGLNQSGSYFPASGQRRLYGESIIQQIYEKEHGIGALYDPTGKTQRWARVAPGDSGSAWWQVNDGFNTIIATTNGQNSRSSSGARVAKYASWIKKIYPSVSLLSDMKLACDIKHYKNVRLPINSKKTNRIYPESNDGLHFELINESTIKITNNSDIRYGRDSIYMISKDTDMIYSFGNIYPNSEVVIISEYMKDFINTKNVKFKSKDSLICK